MNGGVQFQNMMNRVYNALALERRAETRLNALAPHCPCYNSKAAVLNARGVTRSHARQIEQVIKNVTGIEAPPVRPFDGDPGMRIVGTFLQGLQEVLSILENLLTEVLNIIVQTGIDLIRTLFQSIREALDVVIETLRALLQTLLGGLGTGNGNGFDFGLGNGVNGNGVGVNGNGVNGNGVGVNGNGNGMNGNGNGMGNGSNNNGGYNW